MEAVKRLLTELGCTLIEGFAWISREVRRVTSQCGLDVYYSFTRLWN